MSGFGSKAAAGIETIEVFKNRLAMPLKA